MNWAKRHLSPDSPDEDEKMDLSGYFQSRAGAGSQAIPATDAPTLAKFRATADVDEAMSADQLGVHVSVRMWKPG